ncbi:MAG: NYN domain-containing protein [Candidatus Aminicenantes bacterium]|nr:NYN domain-containing protein [Candidatus Aminicenantes bacterium]
MSAPSQKIILVDGYNVINRIPELKPSLDAGLENARTRLALQISSWSHDHPAFECIIVFDGNVQYAGGRDQRLAGVRCIFSRTSHGGDDEIIRFVRNYKGRPSDITVVSDDHNVGNNCRAHGASVQPSSYIMAGKMHRSGGRGKIRARSKVIDKRTADEIDRELRKKFGL